MLWYGVSTLLAWSKPIGNTKAAERGRGAAVEHTLMEL